MPCKTREEQRAYQREWMAARRASYLAGMVCIDCGSPENIEIDHRDPSQKISHRIWSWSRARLEAELAKCDVRCSRCHNARHRTEQIKHGRKRYDKGCRCPVCRVAKAKHNALVRANARGWKADEQGRFF